MVDTKWAGRLHKTRRFLTRRHFWHSTFVCINIGLICCTIPVYCVLVFIPNVLTFISFTIPLLIILFSRVEQSLHVILSILRYLTVIWLRPDICSGESYRWKTKIWSRQRYMYLQWKVLLLSFILNTMYAVSKEMCILSYA